MLGLLGAFAHPAGATPAVRAVDYLAARQDPATGAFSAGDPGAPVARAYTAWAALAFAAVGEDVAALRPDESSLLDALRRQAASARDLVDIARSALAAAAVGADPRSFGGRDLVAELRLRQAPDGMFGGRADLTSWAVLALAAAGERADRSPVAGAVAALRAAQLGDGSWSGGPDPQTGDPVTTAGAVQALRAAGVAPGDPALARARATLAAAQTASGGFSPGPGTRADSLTTAWVVLALQAMGEDLAAPAWGRGGGPRAWLAGLQRPDGSFAYRPGQRAAPTWVAAQVAVALAAGGRPLGSRVPARARSHAPGVIGREPAAGGQIEGRVVVRYRDDPGGTGVDPNGVRLRLNGRDVTSEASITPFTLVLPGVAPARGLVRVAVDLADRAGNRRSVTWTLLP